MYPVPSKSYNLNETSMPNPRKKEEVRTIVSSKFTNKEG